MKLHNKPIKNIPILIYKTIVNQSIDIMYMQIFLNLRHKIYNKYTKPISRAMDNIGTVQRECNSVSLITGIRIDSWLIIIYRQTRKSPRMLKYRNFPLMS